MSEHPECETKQMQGVDTHDAAHHKIAVANAAFIDHLLVAGAHDKATEHDKIFDCRSAAGIEYTI